MRTRAPAAGTLPPSHVAAADQLPLFAVRMTGTSAFFLSDSTDRAGAAHPSAATAVSRSARRLVFLRNMVWLSPSVSRAAVTRCAAGALGAVERVPVRWEWAGGPVG